MGFIHALRDFNAEVDNLLTCLDPNFQIEQMSLWVENAPKVEEQLVAHMAMTDEKVSALQLESRKSQFQSDQLTLARDVAQLGCLWKAVAKSEAASRTEQVLHLKHQNSIGAGIVSQFMEMNLAVHSGSVKEQLAIIDRDRV